MVREKLRARLAVLSGAAVLAGFACAGESPPAAQPAPIFDPSKFVICRSQPGVAEYTYAMSVKASDQVLELVRPPINESAKLSVKLDEAGEVVSAEAVTATAPGFGPLAAAAVEMAAPYPPPPEKIQRCITGRTLSVEVNAQADAQCEDLERSTEWVLAWRDRLLARLRSPAYAAQPGSGFAFLRVDFGPDGHILESEINASPSPELTKKILSAAEKTQPSSRPPNWDQCFRNQPVTLKIEVLSASP